MIDISLTGSMLVAGKSKTGEKHGREFEIRPARSHCLQGNLRYFYGKAQRWSPFFLALAPPGETPKEIKKRNRSPGPD